MKTSKKWFSIFCILLVAVVVLLAAGLSKQKPAQTLSLETLRSRMVYSNMALHNDTCYEFEGAALLELCDFDAWASAELSFWENRPKDAGEHILTLHLGDGYEVAFYAGGYALAFDGYAGANEKDTAWYTLPESAQQAVKTYILENGSVRDAYLGADSWFSIDE